MRLNNGLHNNINLPTARLVGGIIQRGSVNITRSENHLCSANIYSFMYVYFFPPIYNSYRYLVSIKSTIIASRCVNVIPSFDSIV